MLCKFDQLGYGVKDLILSEQPADADSCFWQRMLERRHELFFIGASVGAQVHPAVTTTLIRGVDLRPAVSTKDDH
ncbi:MAG: hypothetical protein WBX22_27275 [Silvibacterium sp.]